MATLSPEEERRLKSEYGDIFGGLLSSGVTPVASSEYMTAGMWDDYIRPGIKWLGDVIPGIGRSDTSSRKTIDESKKLLKDMRDSDLYLRRSEKDAEEEARKELERYLREVEERDKTFKDASLDGAGLDSATVAKIEADEAAGIWPEVASLGDASAFEPKFGHPGVEVAEDAYWEDLIARGLPTETTPDPTPLIDAVSGKTYLSPSEKLAMGIYGTPDAEMRSATAPLYRDTFVEDFIESPLGAIIPAGRSAMEGKSPAEWSVMDYVDLGLTGAGFPLTKSITKGPVAGFERSEWDKLREILKPTTYKATDASTARKAIDKSWKESRFAGEDPIKVREEIIRDGRLLDGYPMGPSVVASLSPITSKMDVLGYLGEIPKGIYDASALKRIKETAAAKAGMTVREFTDWYNRVKGPKELSLDDYIINVTKVPATIFGGLLSSTGAKIYGAGLKPAGRAKELITSPITTGAAKTAGLVSLLAPRRDAEAAETLIDEALYGAEDYISSTPATSVEDDPLLSGYLSPEEKAAARRAESAAASGYVDPLAGYDAYEHALEADKFLGRDYWAAYSPSEDPGKKYLYSPGGGYESLFEGATPWGFYGRGKPGEPLSSGMYIPSYYAEDYYKLPKETLEGIFSSLPARGTAALSRTTDPERVDMAGLLAAIGHKDLAAKAWTDEYWEPRTETYYGGGTYTTTRPTDDLFAPEPVSDYYKDILADMDFKTSPHFGGPALSPEVLAEIAAGVMPGSETTAGAIYT